MCAQQQEQAIDKPIKISNREEKQKNKTKEECPRMLLGLSEDLSRSLIFGFWDIIGMGKAEVE